VAVPVWLPPQPPLELLAGLTRQLPIILASVGFLLLILIVAAGIAIIRGPRDI
jgi:hypothetical protein